MSKVAKRGPILATLTVVVVCRTDAAEKVQYKPNDGPAIPFPNEPDVEKRSNIPDALGNIDYYWKLDDNSEVLQRWLNDLGKLYCEGLPVSEDQKRDPPPLGEFPQGYSLWGHFTKTKEPDGRGVKERVTHDLYGHPSGEEFRSPVEFYPHLRWLAFDAAGDMANCTCKFCDLNNEAEANKKRALKAQAVTNAMKKSIVDRALAKTQAAPPSFQTREPSKEQKADLSSTTMYIYRPGETVWVDRNGNSSIWRLAVIIDRQRQDERSFYLVQLLSNPRHHQPKLVVVEHALRPWLAWSVPDVGVPSLDSKSFDDVKWNELLDNPQYASMDHVVTGSILAAKQIDASFSLFTKFDAQAGIPGSFYSGMFLGAEKIWVGDALRARNIVPGSQTLITVSALVENITPEGKSVVTIIGDKYQSQEVPSNTPRGRDMDFLPERVRDDFEYRNGIVATLRNVRYELRLIERNSRFRLEDINGRWYETRLLLPILKPADQIQQDQRHGRAQDVCDYLNGRRHQNMNEDTRRRNRKDALKASVPEDCKISQGLDKPLEPFVVPPGAAIAPQEYVHS